MRASICLSSFLLAVWFITLVGCTRERVSEPIPALKHRYNSARSLWEQERYHEAVALIDTFLPHAIAPPDDSSAMYYARMAVVWATCEYELGRPRRFLSVYAEYSHLYFNLLPATQVRTTKWAAKVHWNQGHIEEAERLYLLALHRAKGDSTQYVRVLANLHMLYDQEPTLLQAARESIDLKWIYGIVVPALVALLTYLATRQHLRRKPIDLTAVRRLVRDG